MDNEKIVNDAISITRDMLVSAKDANIEKIILLDDQRKNILNKINYDNFQGENLKIYESAFKSLLNLNNELIKQCQQMKINITSDMKSLQNGKHASNAYSQNQY